MGRPRARGGQSRFVNPPTTSSQSPAGSWRPVICEGFFRRNQKTSLKCRDWSRRPTSIFKTAFFKKVSNIKTFFLTFLPSSMRSRDTVKMQGFELAATLVLPSDFQNFFWGARRAPRDLPGRGKRSVLSPSLRGRVAEQDPCIFTRDYASPRPPTL